MSENTESVIEAKAILSEEISKVAIQADEIPAESIAIAVENAAQEFTKRRIRSLVRDLIGLVQDKHEPEAVRSIEFTPSVVRILGKDNSLRVLKLENLPDADWSAPEGSE